MFLKEGTLNGEKFALFCTKVGSFIELRMGSEIPEKALEKLCSIMRWSGMPLERVKQQLREGFLATYAEVAEIFSLSNLA